MLFGELSKTALEFKNIFDVLVGIVPAAQISIMTYGFGSSAGSARKTELLAKQG